MTSRASNSVSPPAVARLLTADITPEPDPKMGRISGMADNAETAKPGQPLIYTVWPKEEKDPPGPQYVTCEYEGGLALHTLLPGETRTCTLRSAEQPAARTETSTRDFYSSAVFTCQ